jgi:hypothetical protein
MKKMIQFLVMSALLTANPTDYSKDVESLDSIIHALYDVISGEKGVARDWGRFTYLFYESGRLMSVGQNKEGKIVTQSMTPEDYIKRADPFLVGNGFFEREIGRRTEQFGYIAHVFSTYDSRHSKSEKEPFARGINSIQLLYDENRWWIISIYWNGESEANQLPRKYLRKR